MRVGRAHRAFVFAAVVAAFATLAAADPPEKTAAGIEAWEVTYKVLQHPRCRNCHPAGDTPLHGDDGHPHSMNVSRTSAKSGLSCTTCHRSKNVPAPHAPPGVPGWRMPDAEMPLVFEGRSSHDLCEQMKDPKRNGHKTVAELAHHVGHDPFVLWGWNPGPGRTTPPIPHAELVRNVEVWGRAGAPCP